jgi:hypothetical protein
MVMVAANHLLVWQLHTCNASAQTTDADLGGKWRCWDFGSTARMCKQYYVQCWMLDMCRRTYAARSDNEMKVQRFMP